MRLRSDYDLKVDVIYVQTGPTHQAGTEKVPNTENSKNENKINLTIGSRYGYNGHF